MDDPKKDVSLDILGIKPIGEALKTVTEASVSGAAAFLSRICLPAAEEFGLLLRDRVRNWRNSNLVRVAAAAEEVHKKRNIPATYSAHPKLVSSIMEHASWEDDETIQTMWAGLLASSCSPAGDDDSNLIFIQKVSAFTGLQARLLSHACETTKVHKDIQGLLWAENLRVTGEDVARIVDCSDFDRLDREMDCLREMELIALGFRTGAKDRKADITPTGLALQLYARCNGFTDSPIDFYGLRNAMPMNPSTRKPYENEATEQEAPADG